jgi:hypothetical protein
MDAFRIPYFRGAGSLAAVFRRIALCNLIDSHPAKIIFAVKFAKNKPCVLDVLNFLFTGSWLL